MQTPSLEITPPTDGGSASFGSLSGVPGDNAALAAALGAKLNLTGGTLTGKLTVTMGTANDCVLASTGYSITGSNAQALIDLAGTWNTTGSPTGIKLNITNTASGASALLMDLQTGGTSRFAVTPAGQVRLASGQYYSNADSASNTGLAIGNDRMRFFYLGTQVFSSLFSGAITIGSGGIVLLDGSVANRLQLGGNTSATPTAQTYSVIGSSGTNTAGVNCIHAAGVATGNAIGGAHIFQTSAASSSGSTTQTLTTRLTIDAGGTVALSSGTVLQLGNTAVAATPTPTHTITMRDGAGVTYRIPCVI